MNVERFKQSRRRGAEAKVAEMEVNRSSVARALVRCALAVVECASVCCRWLAGVFDGCAEWMRRYGDEPEQFQPQSEGRQQVEDRELVKQQQADEVEEDCSGDVSERQLLDMDRLTAPGRFYAVARGRRPGVFQSWFAAGSQVLNVLGAMQERFSSRLEALHYMISYYQVVGCSDDILEYDEYVHVVFRNRQSELPRRR